MYVDMAKHRPPCQQQKGLRKMLRREGPPKLPPTIRTNGPCRAGKEKEEGPFRKREAGDRGIFRVFELMKVF